MLAATVRPGIVAQSEGAGDSASGQYAWSQVSRVVPGWTATDHAAAAMELSGETKVSRAVLFMSTVASAGKVQSRVAVVCTNQSAGWPMLKP